MMGMCREYNSFHADAECAEEQLGLPGRVFLNQLPEYNPDMKHYTLKEYPQLDLAISYGIESSCAEPVFDHSSHTCVGVLEIASPPGVDVDWHDKSFLGQMYDIFQEFGLQCFDGYKHYEMQIGDENRARTTAFQELNTVLKTVCEIHNLPLAMTWVPCSVCNGLLQVPLLSEAVEYCGHNEDGFDEFVEVIKCRHLGKGGVAGMVLSSPNMLYCSDITKLSLTEYPLVPYARQLQFRGWFTLCLQSSHTANDIYTVEFFLPTRNRCGDNSWTLLSLILGTMEDNFKTFKLASGQELGDLLSVEVMDFQHGEKLHYVQKIQAKGRLMLQLRQLDQASTGAIHNGTNVLCEDQNYILPSLEALQNGEVTTQLDSSHQPLLDPPNNGQNVVNAERNIIIVSGCIISIVGLNVHIFDSGSIFPSRVIRAKEVQCKMSSNLEGETNGDDSMSLLCASFSHVVSSDALNFHFPFYLAWDTPKSIASELVEHFDLSNEDLTLIAELIGSSFVKLVANLKPKLKQ
ncbi:hypothetical protein RHSIM_RhsimUnG0164200 [Rhododendron simsii]|uniref:NLP1-9 GAF domain-containing protein n=1 Tax=Rhododendron simsii TaxID=118357 RepID=A0A834FV10_RHOSS|nr:hypothetical protein RHSIM_RhsimUnG0164200 [Rhododendron simsii]